MFKSILKCSIFVLVVLTVAACNQDDDRRHRGDGDGNGATCYRNGHSSASCHKN